MQIHQRPREIALDVGLEGGGAGKWVFRAATHAERKAHRAEHAKCLASFPEAVAAGTEDGARSAIEKVALERQVALLEFEEHVSRSVANMTVRLVGLGEDWPADADAQLDFLALLDDQTVAALYSYAQEHCYGLGRSAEGN